MQTNSFTNFFMVYWVNLSPEAATPVLSCCVRVSVNVFYDKLTCHHFKDVFQHCLLSSFSPFCVDICTDERRYLYYKPYHIPQPHTCKLSKYYMYCIYWVVFVIAYHSPVTFLRRNIILASKSGQ